MVSGQDSDLEGPLSSPFFRSAPLGEFPIHCRSGLFILDSGASAFEDAFSLVVVCRESDKFVASVDS